MLRVMIVDDEPLARQAMRQLLAEHPDVSLVAEAEGVRAAAELVREQKPDALFLDIRMPGASGFDLLRHSALRTRRSSVRSRCR
jgi:YesN/AraC family two-component response regulator